MTEWTELTYYDRLQGTLRTEPIYAAAFLFWSYNTRIGQVITDLVFRHKWVSQVYGWFHKRRWSRRKICAFAKRVQVNLDELTRPLDAYESFNDFFTREIDLSMRHMQTSPEVCISPVDGRALVYPAVEPDTTFRIKRGVFNLRKLLCDDALASQFAGGSMFISRLYLSDYHHFHFPDSGTPSEAVSLPGKYYAVSPYARCTLVPFYSENHRMLTRFHTDHFGLIAMVEIGAFTVGSIQQRYLPDVHADRGARKGFFEIGGSTVVFLFQPDAIAFDEDLLENTSVGIETYVRLGDSIGRKP